ncbi:MAG: molecular chaperone GrpE [Oscillatoriales cyanobacterium SM2_1_8]|nr:molecular chaperone GrpE [Oscillatoriales cyanobacterium SM2_1_8]
MTWWNSDWWWPGLAAFNLMVVGLVLWGLRPKAAPPVGVPPADPNPTAALRAECERLQAAAQTQTERDRQQFQRETFAQLQSLLVQYPSFAPLVHAKPDWPAKNLIGAFAPLQNLVQAWHLEPIGTPWQATAFDPQQHQPDRADIQPGETVYVRFVGYRQGEEILVPAKVSRTLPPVA